jgi:hypothetical protein
MQAAEKKKEEAEKRKASEVIEVRCTWNLFMNNH